MLDSRQEESDIGAMRRLMLLRHAKTERAVPGERDRDRKLTKRGRADAPAIGAYMARHGSRPRPRPGIAGGARPGNLDAACRRCFAKTPKTVNEERIYNADPEKLMGLVAETRGARTAARGRPQSRLSMTLRCN